MFRSRLRRRVPIPRSTTTKAQTKDYSYVKGFNTNKANDEAPADLWRYITDAREIEIGKWKTRKGADRFSVPIGEAVNVEQTSTTGASDFAFSPSTRFAKKVVATATGPLTKLEANLRNANSATGTIVLAVYEDNSGEPGTELFRTTIAASDLGSSYAYEVAHSVTCPTLTNGSTYWVVGYVQEGGTGSYQVSSTTSATTGLSSSDSGATWAAANVDFNVKVYTSTAGGVKGHTRVQSSGGVSYTFIAHGTTVYSVNESTGATTSIDTGLHASTTEVNFEMVNDTLFYADGYQKPRKHVLDSGTASELTDAPEAAADVIEHKGFLFFLSAIDTTKVYYTNFADYDEFTSTDFIYVPAPKTGDPVKNLAKLNGQLYFVTRNNKHVLFGAENATFRLDEAIGQKGTFNANSCVFDQNFIFLASDDGVYQFNGADEKNITENPDGGILNDYLAILDKTTIKLELHEGRLYVFYRPNGESEVTECLVYNYEYGIWESKDTRTYVATTSARFDPDNYFLLGSNRAGFLMRAEQDTNDHNMCGEPLTYELRTRYEHYDAPAQFKRAPTFRPHFDTVTKAYSVQVGYATDYQTEATYEDVSLQGNAVTFDSGVLFDSGAVFGGSAQVNPLDDGVQIPGEWRRLQLRYKHEAAREPVSFDGHVIEIETQRLI